MTEIIASFESRSEVLTLVSDLTQLLDRASDGDLKAAADLLPLVYDELRRPAALNPGCFW